MKFKGSGSKGTRVIERKRSVTNGQTDRRTDSQTDRRTRQKQYVSPRGGGDIMIKYFSQFVLLKSMKLIHSI